MFSYSPHVYIISTKNFASQHDQLRVDDASTKIEATNPRLTILPEGVSHPSYHMNGHVVSDRQPFLGPGYKIVEPPQGIVPRRPKMAPTPDPAGANTTLRFSVSSVSNTREDPVRSEPNTKAETSKPRLMRSQSTQTEQLCGLEKASILSRSPSAPPFQECCYHTESVLRSRGAFTRASWSAKAHYSDSSSGEGADAATDTDLSYSLVTARNPIEECPLSVILIGDSGTGKTCLVAQLADNIFMTNYDVTVGIDFNIARFHLPDGRPVRLQVWDTAGQEKYRAITSSYYRKAMGVVLVYDVTRRESLDNILNIWRKEVEQYAESDVVLMLVGNKMDLDDYRTITTRVGAKVAEQLGAIFFEVSAKENLNIHLAFQAFAEVIVESVYSKRNPCLSTTAVHLDYSNHDRNENVKKTKRTCNCS
ncbi:ras-related protein Rab-3B-like isoform X2 [Acanthaster planci]|nr:ras-related protein Rab-3B-like isoform X2 [Acanthaster planci]